MKKNTCFLIVLLASALILSTFMSATHGDAAYSPVDEWSMFRRDAAHSGVSTGNQPADSYSLLWNFTVGAAVFSSPAIVNGCVFVGSDDYNVYCLNASSGQLIWNFTTGGSVKSSPAIYGGYVYVGCDDGWLYCLDVTTGYPLWISMVGGAVASSPIVVNDCVYVGSGKQGLFCFNASDGSLVWVFPCQCRVDSSPAVLDGVVYFAADDFSVNALNATTGSEIWSCHTGSVASSPCINNDFVYIGTVDGYVCCLDAKTGGMLWSFQTQNFVDSSPAVFNGYLYFGSEDNNFYCLNATNGEKVWQTATGYWVKSSPAISGDNVYVGSEDYSLYCFDAFTGEKKWSYATGDYVDSSPAVVNGVLYVGSCDKHIYALNLTSATAEPQQKAASLAWSTVAFDAAAFAVASTIILAAIKIARFNRQTIKNQPTNELVKGKLRWFSKHTDALFVLAIVAFSTIFFLNLNIGPLWIADEQTYSQWAYHMVKTGDYIVPHAFGGDAIWIAKPPLYMWLMSLSYQAFGVSNVTSRLWSPIFGVLTLILLYFLGKKLYNSYVGFASALVLGTFTMFFSYARHAMTDVALVFFMVASIYFFVLSEKDQKVNRYLLISGVFFGLALLTKQVEAMLIPLTVFIYLIVTKRSVKFLFTKRFTAFWGVGFLLVAPWVVVMLVSFGSNFWYWFVVYTAFSRTIIPLEGHFGNFFFYFNFLFNNERLWSIILPFAAGLCIFEVFKRSKPDALLLTWMGCVLLVFTLAQTKLSWYLLPAYPAFALAIGNLLYQAPSRLWWYFGKKRVSKSLEPT
jgi:outer membrane protein assembly factor BamB